jgi:hypothetical protein
MSNDQAKIGSRVETVSQHPDEQDAGVIVSVEGDEVTVAWDTGTRTTVTMADIELE